MGEAMKETITYFPRLIGAGEGETSCARMLCAIILEASSLFNFNRFATPFLSSYFRTLFKSTRRSIGNHCPRPLGVTLIGH